MEDARLPTMRASDADRERILEVVRQAHAEGRLSTDEFYERLEAVYQARTYAALDVVVHDLPAIGAPPPPLLMPDASPRRSAPAQVPTGSLFAQLPRELRAVWITWATAVSINLLIWFMVYLGTTGALSSDPTDEYAPYFWPIWVAGPWGIVLLGSTVAWWFNRGNDDENPPALPPGSR